MADGRDNGGPQDTDWTNWQPIDAKLDHKGPATYKVRMVTDEEAPVPIPRFFSCDNSGLLVIGETSRMRNRRNGFVRGMNTGRGHSEGNLFHFLIQHGSLNQRFPVHHLEFCYVPTVNKGAAKLAEERLIKRYVREFGEVPPLNSAIPNRYASWEL